MDENRSGQSKSAIFNNRCYTFLAQNIQKVSDLIPDQTEDIEVALIPLMDIPEMIRTGRLTTPLSSRLLDVFSPNRCPRWGQTIL